MSNDPIVIAHRGASGYRPEHTLAAYELAIEMGADFIEPDLVSTADDVLVARHENEISGTTDVADHAEFAGRHTSKVVDGAELTGWFTEDFTVAELKTLRAIERIPDVRPTSSRYDGLFEILTLDEIIDLVESARSAGRDIGIYPETKHPTYFDGIGHNLDGLLLETLSRRGLNSAESKVFIESMEAGNLRSLRSQSDIGLIQLMPNHGRPFDFEAAGDPRTYADLATAEGLAEIAGYAQGIGAHKDLVIHRDDQGRSAAVSPLVAEAHAYGLLVHVWTIRDECERFFAAGVDGVFSDHPDTAVAALRGWLGN